MIGFIIAATVITLIGLVLILRPLFNTRNTLSYKREAQNIHYAKERLQELEEQLKNANISATDYEALKLEIESTLAQDIELEQQNNSAQAFEDEQREHRPNHKLITLLAILIPIGTILTYLAVGNPQAINSEQTTQTRPSKQQIDLMVSTIEQRLQNQPNDIEGWRVLARTYLAIGEYQKSIDANLQLLALSGEDANIYAHLADATALLNNGDLSGQTADYINKALSLNNQHPQALWLAGLSSAQQGDLTKARNYWSTLLPLLKDSPQQQQELQDIINQTLSQQSPEKPLVSKPTNFSSTKKTSDNANNSGIRVLVKLADSVRDQAKPDETVFVFIRAKDGPPAPLAVKPLLVSDLPVEIVLNDDNAMMPQLKLSLFEDVVVSARIAKSGNPIAKPGDIQSQLVMTKSDTKETIELEISEVL